MTLIKHTFIIVVSLALQIACVSSAQEEMPEQAKVERRPFQKSSYVIKQPRTYSLEETENGKIYDPKPKVVIVDERSGKYEFRWIGIDGKEKIVAYQRHDAIDAVVEATVERTSEAKRLYKYKFNVLPSSPIYFMKFFVQTFASDVSPVQVDSKLFRAGTMTNLVSPFKIGTWRSFGFIGEENERIYGGKSSIFQLSSSSLPGIVKCQAAGGELGTTGVGEDLPPALEREIPIFADYAHGYTIGPVESLAGLSKQAKARYIVENLAKFQEAGWMTDGTAKTYASLLKEEDLQGAFEQAKKDMENEFITSEVFHIIEGLTR